MLIVDLLYIAAYAESVRSVPGMAFLRRRRGRLLAFDRFRVLVRCAGLFVMSTYVPARYLIVEGFGPRE